MTHETPTYAHEIITRLGRSSPGQHEFFQAVEEVLSSIQPLLDAEPHYREHAILERMVEPERQVLFRVVWEDDTGRVHVNKGYRVQFNSALGPYKGGLRFHPSVRADTIKFLGFEQTFKNALTGLPLGAGKGGSDFDPKGRSDREVMRFCQAFMSELYRHVGPTCDVPAGDTGVGAREIGYLYGQYKRLTGRNAGVLTGKGPGWGGSLGRTEATGYGLVYFTQSMLEDRGESLDGARCLVSGSGNVAIYTIEKLYDVGALPVTCSDSSGTVYHERGIDLPLLKQLKEVERTSLRAYAERHPDAEFVPVDAYPRDGHAVWRYAATAAFPCATQNELSDGDADALLAAGVRCVAEGANMPSTAGAVHRFVDARIAYGPGKAANAGGVAVSQLEMAQNASMQHWSMTKVDTRLRTIMADIYRRSADTAAAFGAPHDLVLGANTAGFRRVADAMIAHGIV
ncbi:MAG: NADP-specific glutamate dehydrogenase [Trueperaceae bacterium]|nr:NADP-specific glutamate dehydrogenase [Trueperaceae bacterium]